MEYNPREEVLVREQSLPKDYHCKCPYCKDFMGVLVRNDGAKYSRLERRKYYSKLESKMNGGGHIAKTPLHVARWAIQKYSSPGDWVMDPTMGAGTTAVESVINGRNVFGMEIQFNQVIAENLETVRKSGLWNTKQCEARVLQGDARDIGKKLDGLKKKFQLIVNNPPYSGDESQKGMGKAVGSYSYDRSKKNLAFLSEGSEYYETMLKIYTDGVKHLKPGGHLVIGVKDMMRNKKAYCLHEYLCNIISEIKGLQYIGMALLPHYPTTLFMNTYKLHWPDAGQVPMYQTINVFRRQK